MGYARAFLTLNGLVWITYAVAVALRPEIFAQLTGIKLEPVIRVVHSFLQIGRRL